MKESEVDQILSNLGLSASETIRLLYRKIKLQRGLPFDVRIPNELTTRRLRRSRTGKDTRRFATKQELCAALDL